MRAFLAVDLPQTIRDKLVALQDELKGPCIRLVPPQNIHATVNFLGEITEVKATEIVEKLKAKKLQKQRIEVNGVGVFPARGLAKVVWVGAKGIEPLAEASAFVGRATDVGHFTLARLKCRVDLAEFLQRYAHQHFGGFVVEEVVLYESTLTKTGAHYKKRAFILLE